MEKLRGEVTTVTFRDPTTGYTVLKVAPHTANSTTPATVVGVLVGIAVGDEVEFYGKWGVHKKFGKQFVAESYQIIMPTSLEGLKNYLVAHIKGIGPVYAKKIIDKFGSKTAQILENEPAKLAQIQGITKSKAIEIGRAWKQDAAIRQQLIKLSALGISPKLALKIINKYNDAAYQTIKTNPYQLAEDIWGIGFTKADKIAQNLGITADHPLRIRAAIIYTLQKAVENGHLYLPREELIQLTQDLVEAPPEKIVAGLEQLIQEQKLVGEQEAIYLRLYHQLEQQVAALIYQLQQRQATQSQGEQFDFQHALSWIEQQQGFRLNRQQQAALELALSNPLSILTGGPGTGKSTTLHALVTIAALAGKKIALAAPTGRAAKRITELTGKEAKTLHRLLKIDQTGKAYYNQQNPLPVDLLVIDEASMLDIFLTYRVLAALGPTAHLLLVGDSNQLPSVQAGNVLGDLIRSGKIPVVSLTEIFRQAQKSAIVRNAHKINAGVYPEFPPHPTDFYFFKEEDAERAAELIVELVRTRIPNNFNLNPRQDIQVLAPLYKTACGVGALNEKLQAALNPKTTARKPEIRYGYQLYRVGDRVMQTVNNYEKEVFNGEIGTIVRIEQIDDTSIITVNYEDNTVNYSQDELYQLTLAYAVSVHKSQGSEYPAIVMPILTSHYIMLARNLLYTAVTRARKLVVLVGSKKAIGIALRNNKAAKRYTLLAERLKTLAT